MSAYETYRHHQAIMNDHSVNLIALALDAADQFTAAGNESDAAWMKRMAREHAWNHVTIFRDKFGGTTGAREAEAAISDERVLYLLADATARAQDYQG